MPDYPASIAERRRIRERLTNDGAARGRVHALWLVTSSKCSTPPGHHADEPYGCANDGSTCLCECHDPHQPEETDA